MKRVRATSGAKLLQFEPLRVVAAVLIGVISPLATLDASQVDERSVFCSACHILFSKQAAADGLPAAA
jgi:hypothetical protein